MMTPIEYDAEQLHKAIQVSTGFGKKGIPLKIFGILSAVTLCFIMCMLYNCLEWYK